MNIYDFMMIFCFITGIALILVKIWNLMSSSEFYSNIFNQKENPHLFDIKMSLMTYVLILIAHFCVFIIFMIQPERTIFKVLFLFFNGLNMLSLVVTIAEVIWGISRIPSQRVNAYKSPYPQRR